MKINTLQMRGIAFFKIDSSLSPASPLGYCWYAYQAFAPVNVKSNVSAGNVIIEASIQGNLYYYPPRAASSKEQQIHIKKTCTTCKELKRHQIWTQKISEVSCSRNKHAVFHTVLFLSGISLLGFLALRKQKI